MGHMLRSCLSCLASFRWEACADCQYRVLAEMTLDTITFNRTFGRNFGCPATSRQAFLFVILIPQNESQYVVVTSELYMLEWLTVASSKTPAGIGYLLLGVLGFNVADQLSPAEIRALVTGTAM